MMRAVILFGMLGWVGSLIWSAFNGLGIESAFPAAITSALVMGVIGLGAFSLLRTIVETVAGDRSEEADLEEIEAPRSCHLLSTGRRGGFRAFQGSRGRWRRKSAPVREHIRGH